MIKLSAAILMLFMCISSKAQVTASLGRFRAFKMEKGRQQEAALTAGNEHYFVFASGSISNRTYTVISVDKDGNVTNANDIIKFDPGRPGDGNYIHGFKSLGNKLLLLFENRNRDEQLSTMIIRTVQSDATVNNDDVKAGSYEYGKMTKSEDWFAATTPDNKHLAIVGKFLMDKEGSDRLKIFFLDENLKLIAKNEVALPEGKKKISFNSTIFASDKGDIYLTQNAFDKSYPYPILYKTSVNSPEISVTPVQIADASSKNMSYAAAVSSAGDLVMAGYFQHKSTITVGAVNTMGTWLYNSAKPSEVKTFMFDKPVPGMEARGVVFNGNTTFLIGEQYTANRLTPTTQQSMNFEESYDYTHKDILVTAFDEAWEKKFELRMNNDWKTRDFDQSLYPAFGIINNKLAVIYNDQYNKYFTDRKYSNDKLPVLVSVTNDGLMEAPVTFEKELDPAKTGYTIYPKFMTGDGKSEILILAGSGPGIKAAIFR